MGGKLIIRTSFQWLHHLFVVTSLKNLTPFPSVTIVWIIPQGRMGPHEPFSLPWWNLSIPNHIHVFYQNDHSVFLPRPYDFPSHQLLTSFIVLGSQPLHSPMEGASNPIRERLVTSTALLPQLHQSAMLAKPFSTVTEFTAGWSCFLPQHPAMRASLEQGGSFQLGSSSLPPRPVTQACGVFSSRALSFSSGRKLIAMSIAFIVLGSLFGLPDQQYLGIHIWYSNFCLIPYGKKY